MESRDVVDLAVFSQTAFEVNSLAVLSAGTIPCLCISPLVANISAIELQSFSVLGGLTQVLQTLDTLRNII